MESTLGELFEREQPPFRRGTRLFCSQCQQRWHARLHQLCVVIVLLLLPYALIANNTGAGTPNVTNWLVSNSALFALLEYLSVPMHELGHAFAARWLKIPVQCIILGLGRTVAHFRFLGWYWDMREAPGSGLVVAGWSTPPPSTPKQAMFVAAGPLTNLLLALGALAFMDGAPWQFASLTRGFDASRMFFWANVALICRSLYPHTLTTALGKLPSDGLRLLTCWRAARTFQSTGQDKSQITIRFDDARAGTTSQTASGGDGQTVGLNVRQLQVQRDIAALEAGEIDKARLGMTAHLGRPDLTPLEIALAQNNLAYVLAIEGGAAELAKADELSQAALSALPWEPSVVGTRGAVLVAMGRYAEAETRLEQSLRRTNTAAGVAQNLCWLARAAIGQGDVHKARKLVLRARRLNPECFMLQRVESLLPSNHESSRH